MTVVASMSNRLVPISIARILVGVDGSEHSKKAIELGVDLASRLNAEIYFIHVLEETSLPQGFEEYARIEHMDYASYFEAANEQFLVPAGDRAKAAGIKKIEPLSVSGDPADEILRAAETYQVDLIILGSRGLGKFSRDFLGSVSAKVLNHSKCTCIVVK